MADSTTWDNRYILVYYDNHILRLSANRRPSLRGQTNWRNLHHLNLPGLDRYYQRWYCLTMSSHLRRLRRGLSWTAPGDTRKEQWMPNLRSTTQRTWSRLWHPTPILRSWMDLRRAWLYQRRIDSICSKLPRSWYKACPAPILGAPPICQCLPGYYSQYSPRTLPRGHEAYDHLDYRHLRCYRNRCKMPPFTT